MHKQAQNLTEPTARFGFWQRKLSFPYYAAMNPLLLNVQICTILIAAVAIKLVIIIDTYPSPNLTYIYVPANVHSLLVCPTMVQLDPTHCPLIAHSRTDWRNTNVVHNRCYSTYRELYPTGEWCEEWPWCKQHKFHCSGLAWGMVTRKQGRNLSRIENKQQCPSILCFYRFIGKQGWMTNLIWAWGKRLHLRYGQYGMIDNSDKCGRFSTTVHALTLDKPIYQ